MKEPVSYGFILTQQGICQPNSTAGKNDGQKEGTYEVWNALCSLLR